MSDTSLVFNLVARDRASSTLSRVGERINSMAAGIGAGAGMLLGAGLVQSLDVGAANAKLAAQLGLTQTESERVGKIAGDLYANAYGDSIEQVNTAVSSVMSSIKGMSNASSADLQTATEAALNFAQTFDIEVDRAVQTAGTLINSGLATDATQAFDLITAASQKVPAQLREDVLDASDEYGQFFRTLGYSGEEAFSLLVDASEKGQFGIDKAGDAIKEFTIRSTDMSASSKAAYETIGLDARDMANAILAGGDKAQSATQKIIDGLLGVKDPADRANAAIGLFGTPIEDLNVQDIPAFLESLKGASGSMDGFSGAAGRSGDALRDNAATALEEFKRKAMGAVAEVGGRFAQFALENQTVFVPLAITLAGLAAVVLTVKAAMMTYAAISSVVTAAHTVMTASAWGVIGGWLRMTAVGLMTYLRIGAGAVASGAVTAAAWTGSALAAIGTFMAAVLRAALSVTATYVRMAARAVVWAAVTAGSWLAAFWPIALIIVAVAGLVALIVIYWDQIKAWTLAAWNWVVAKLIWAKNMMIAAFMNFTLIGLIIKHWSTIKAKTLGAWNAVIAWLRGVPGMIYRAFLNFTPIGLMIKHWNTIKRVAIDRALQLASWMRSLPGRIAAAIGSLGGLLYDKGRSVVTGLWNGIKSMGGWLASTLAGWAKSVIPGPIAKALGIGSPSRVLAEVVGRWLPPGIVMGAQAEAPAMNRALGELVDPQAARPPAPLTAGMAPLAGAASGSVQVRVLVDVRGADEDLKKLFRKIVRVDGGGSVQTGLGRA